MQIHDLPDPRIDREGFLAVRQGFFNASDTSVLLNRHPFKTAADVWMSKVVGSEQEETAAMRRGQHLESAVLSWWEQEYGRKAEPNNKMFSVGRLAATPDAFVGDGHLIEINTTSLYTGGIPQQYWLDQVQTQLICCEADTATIVFVDASMTLNVAEVHADHELQSEIVTKANTFMEAVDAELMPDYVALQAKHVIDMHPAPKGSIDGGEDGCVLAADYYQHKQAEKHHKEQAADLRDALAATMLDYDTLTYNDNPIATFKARATPAGFDKTRFKDEHPGLFEEYTTPAGSTRVLNIPKRVKEQIENE